MKARERVKTETRVYKQQIQSLRVYYSLIESAPHIVLVLSEDLQLKILFANLAVARFLHIHAASVIGRCVLSVILGVTSREGGSKTILYISISIGLSCQ